MGRKKKGKSEKGGEEGRGRGGERKERGKEGEMTMGFCLPKVIFLVTSLAGYAFALRAVAVFVI